MDAVPVVGITAGSGLFALVTWRVVGLHPAAFTVLMATGAVAWLVGKALWLAGWPFPQLGPCWMAILALTIVGERVERAGCRPGSAGTMQLDRRLGCLARGPATVAVEFEVAPLPREP